MKVNNLPTALIVGCGSIGRRHAKNLSDLGCGIITFDIDENKKESLATEVGASTASSMEDALSKSPDIAVISTPSDHHINPATKAARANCDLFIEKPLSNNTEGVEKLISIAKENDLVTMIGSNFRFHPAITTIKELLEKDIVGNIVSARIEGGSYLPDWHPDEDYRKMYSAKAGVGGALLDYIHELNYARWLFGEVEKVTAMLNSASSLEIDTEDSASLITEFTDDEIVEFHLDYIQRPYSRSCHIVGEKGTIRWEWDWSSVKYYNSQEGEWVTENKWPEYEANQMYIDEMKHFLQCVNNKKETRSTLSDGYKDLKIAVAAKDSAKSGRHIEL
jgi:predicted dehydrogenase